ncbi:hypothetical protein HK102_006117 [Quaeritorhiza haematococci]|nr:hypothetical protein HK102_006117 [Quaeritorhiza haematococci]
MVSFKSLFVGLLITASPATAAIVDALFHPQILEALQESQFTKVGVRVTCKRVSDYTHNDQRELMPLASSVTITTDRCKKDPSARNRPGSFESYELKLYKDNGEEIVCGVFPGTKERHATTTNPRVAQAVTKCDGLGLSVGM